MRYRIATDDEKRKVDCCEDYDLLIGPRGFECLLTEPEDRRWCRDGKDVITELNRLDGLLEDSLEIINDAIMHGMPVTDKVAKLSNAIRGVD